MIRLDKDRRLGRFSVSMALVDDSIGGARNGLLLVMERCIVLRAEAMHAYGVIEYVAWSPDFEVIQDGLMAPEYTWDIASNDGVVSVSASRVAP